jgi:glycosyltransferase involved in cell wall biosynthesis
MDDLLNLLCEAGWQCEVVCGPETDSEEMTLRGALLATGLSPTTIRLDAPLPVAVHRIVRERVPVMLVEPALWHGAPAFDQGFALLAVLDRVLTIRRPDVLLTYGGGWLGRGIAMIARRHGIPVVFWLRNTGYRMRDLFADVSGVLVPSHFTATYYKQSLGLHCTVIPSPIRLNRAQCEERSPRFATFVSPNPNKGVFYFARIASELGRLRSDIPLLVVVGRGSENWLNSTGLDLRSLPNLTIMPATPDPRQFLRVTKALLVPSLWDETFARVSAEGIVNGIPSLASRRAGIPETLGGSGFLFDVAAHHTTESRHVPTATEVRPWIQTLERLWDDSDFYCGQVQRCLTEAQRFDCERLQTSYESALLHVMNQGTSTGNWARSLGDCLKGLQQFFPQPIGLDHCGSMLQQLVGSII